MIFRFQDRVFIPQVELRKLLKRFAGGCERSKALKNLTEEDKTEMLNLMKSCSLELYSFVVLIGANRLLAPEYARKFLLSLASTSPVCAYVPVNQDVLNGLKRIVAGEQLNCDPISWLKLQQFSPVIFDILSKSSSPDVPAEFSKLLQELINKATGIFAHCLDVEEELTSTTDDSAYFLSLPLLRNQRHL